jgi:Fe-S-cluster containining protein
MTTMKSPDNKALELALQALKWTDEAIYKFASLESLPEPLDCKPGCHYCCFNLPVVTPPEALLVGYHVEQAFTAQEKKEINDRIEKIIERIDGISPYEVAMMRHELPCIFLKDAMCMIYEVRPAVCRTCTSTSAEHCKMIFESRNHRARLKCYQKIREIFQTVHSRLVDHCREMGCQTDALPLPEAVKDYFRHPEPIEAWLQGKVVFRPR